MTFWSSRRLSRSFARPILPLLALSLTALAAQAQVTTHAALTPAAPTQLSLSQDSQAASAPGAQPTAATPRRVEPSPEQMSPPRTLTAKAVDKVKQVAKSAGDIFSRVPCSPPKGGLNSLGSLPHVANRLIAGQPVVIIAFGSSSTQGWGSSAPEFTYPNRLAAQLRRHYPSADITVINAGVGGEDAPEMIKRLQTEVIDVHPDLVIWQVGTNAVLRNLDPGDTAKMVEDGIARIQAAGGGADVVLVDPQYSPQVTQRADSANKMV